jgi:S1-C subfamily serine protease
MQISVTDPNIDSGIIFNPQVAKTVPPCKLGNSDSAQVGDIIAVISSPEGWHDTATVGRIANIHQSLGEADKPAWNDLIFIDADILQGSSGGMTIGTDGLVYGSIMGVTGQHADIGIGERAICPSNKIQALLQTIKK